MSFEDKIAAAFLLSFSAVVIGGTGWWSKRKSAQARAQRAHWILARKWPLVLGAMGAVMSIMGVGMVTHASYVTEVELNLASCEGGVDVHGSFVRVSGHPRPEAVLCRKGRRGSQSCYTPNTSTPNGSRVAILIAGIIETRQLGSWSGFTSQSSLASFQSRVRAKGLEPTEDLTRIILESRTERAVAGRYVSLAGVAMLLIGWFWLRARR